MTTNSPHWPPGVHSFRLPWWRAVAGGFLQPTDPRATVEAPGAPGWPPQGRASSACSSWHLQASIRFGIPAKFPPWPERERTSFDHPVQDALISCPGIMAEAPVPFREKSSPDSQGLSGPQLGQPPDGTQHVPQSLACPLNTVSHADSRAPPAPAAGSHPQLSLSRLLLPHRGAARFPHWVSVFSSFSVPGEGYRHGCGGRTFGRPPFTRLFMTPEAQACGDPNQAGVLFPLPLSWSRS